MPKKLAEIKACEVAYNNFQQTREIQGVEINCIPEKPPIKEIANYSKKIKDRKWKPIEIPEVQYKYDKHGDITDSYFEGFDEDEEHELLSRFYKYRTEGYWFFNKDKLEYITGDHWYYLNVVKIPIVKKINGRKRKVSDNPWFIDADRDFFLYWKQAESENGCFGVIFTAARRVGKTFKALAILLNNATSIPEAVCGIQAQNGSMASSIFNRLIKMWKKLPRHQFFYPTHKGLSDPSRALEFVEPSKRSSKQQYYDYGNVLESVIDHRPTKANAYDSEGLWRLYIDEASKMETCDIMELYDVVREVLADGSTALGKMLVTSTAENLGGKTLQSYEKLWKQSDVTTRDAFGTTKSGLYRYFQSSVKGYRHSPEEDGNLPKELDKPTIDEWGYSDEETAKKVIEYLRRNKGGDSLIQFIRKYPFNAKEAFMYAEVVSPLNIENINQHIMHNEEVEQFRELSVRGNLDWAGGIPDTEVVWHPREDGMWQMFMLPDKEDRNLISQRGTGKTPTGNNFVSSVDPFSHRLVQDEKRASMAASHVMTITGGKYNDRTFVLQYHGRRSDPNDFFEDMIKQCVFYSCKLLPENQKYEVINYFRKRGYAGYIQQNPLNEKTEDGISTRGDNTRSTLVNRLASYIDDELGQQADGTYKDVPFTSLLEDWRDFDSENWTKFDLTVSAMICILAATEKKEQKVSKITLKGFIQKFDVRR